MNTKEKIVNMLGDILGREYFYDSKTNEAYYWKDDPPNTTSDDISRFDSSSHTVCVCTPFEDFVNLAFEKWSKTPITLT